MALNPAFKGNRGVAGVAAGGAVLLPPPLLPPPTTWSTAALLWFRNFSSRRHFALRLLNHTCNRRNDGAFVTIRGVVTPSDAALALSRTSLHVSPLPSFHYFFFLARARLLFSLIYLLSSSHPLLSVQKHSLHTQHSSHAILFLVRFFFIRSNNFEKLNLINLPFLREFLRLFC